MAEQGLQSPCTISDEAEDDLNSDYEWEQDWDKIPGLRARTVGIGDQHIQNGFCPKCLLIFENWSSVIKMVIEHGGRARFPHHNSIDAMIRCADRGCNMCALALYDPPEDLLSHEGAILLYIQTMDDKMHGVIGWDVDYLYGSQCIHLIPAPPQGIYLSEIP